MSSNVLPSLQDVRRVVARVVGIEKRVKRVERKLASWVILSGSGSPQSAVEAPVGALYLRTDGGAATTLYVKESGTGNTGWVAK